MGHKTIQMTMRYAHLAPEHNASAVAKLDKSRKQLTPVDKRTFCKCRKLL